MKKINLKGVTAESAAGILILIVALVNAVLQMLGMNTLPFSDNEISEIISTLFLTTATLYNVYKNRNITIASQKAQEITDALKSGELLFSEVDALLKKIKTR